MEWLIPVLWPIDLILPRRGPTPTLKPEAELMLMLEDVGIPTKSEVQHQPEMIFEYNYADNQPEQQAAAPIERASQPMQQPVQQAYAQPNPTVVVVQAAPAPTPVVVQQQAPPVKLYGSGAPVVYGYPPPGYGYPPPPYYYRPLLK